MAHLKCHAHVLQSFQQKYKQYYSDKTIEVPNALWATHLLLEYCWNMF